MLIIIPIYCNRPVAKWLQCDDLVPLTLQLLQAVADVTQNTDRLCNICSLLTGRTVSREYLWIYIYICMYKCLHGVGIWIGILIMLFFILIIWFLFYLCMELILRILIGKLRSIFKTYLWIYFWIYDFSSIYIYITKFVWVRNTILCLGIICVYAFSFF